MSSKPLVEGEDYTVEDGKLVFTSKYLLERGHCCNSGCRNCPYRQHAAGTPSPADEGEPKVERIVIGRPPERK